MEIIRNIVIVTSHCEDHSTTEQQSDDKKVGSASPVPALPAIVTALLVAGSLSP